MQNAKDTFFITLLNRIAAINPNRTIVVRGTLRPGVLVEENELPTAAILPDAFRLDWTALHLDPEQPMSLAAMTCTIRYATDGTAGNGGMDRGRALSAMDGELSAALTQAPQCAPKVNYTTAINGAAPATMATSIFWSDPVFGACEAVGERLVRTATVQVYSYQEAGEL